MIVFVIIAFIVAILGFIVYKLKKQDKQVNVANIKAFAVGSVRKSKAPPLPSDGKIVKPAVAEYTRKHLSGTDDVQMKSKENPGYLPE